MAVYVLTLAAGLLFATGSVVQQRVAFDAPPGKNLRISLLFWLFRQRLWLVGVVTAFFGNIFSAFALGMGSVALVQPLLVVRLLFALPLAAAFMRQQLSRRDMVGAVATAGGLAAFIAIGRPEPGHDTGAPLWRWAVTAGAIALVTLTLVALARRLNPAREAPMLGAGAGMLFGLQSGLMHTAVRSFIEGGVGALLLNWTTYMVAVTAVLGTLLAQSAYEMAPLPASYPALAAVEPLAGIGIGVGVLGGALTFGAVPLTLELLGLAVMTAGIYLLATSPLVTGQRGAMERRQAEETAYRVEEDLRTELARLEESLLRLEESGGAAAGEQAAADLHERLRRVDRGLDRLATAKAVGRAADRVVEAPDTTDVGNDATAAEPDRHRQMMDRWQHEIEEREQSLRAGAQRLRERLDALR